MIKRLLATLLAFLSFAVFAAVDVNKGTAAEVDGVKGIGPAISTKIVDERKKGNFKDWADFITRVSGIGDKSAAKLSEAGLTVNGSAFSGAPAAAPAKAAAKPAMADKPAMAAKPAMADKPVAAAPAAAPAADAKADAKAEKKAKAEADKKAKAEAKADAKAEKAAKKADKAAAAASAAKK